VSRLGAIAPVCPSIRWQTGPKRRQDTKCAFSNAATCNRYISDLLSPADTLFTAYGVQILLVTSLIILGIFIIADTLPSIYWVVRSLINERKQAKLDASREKIRVDSAKSGLGIAGGDSGNKPQLKSLKSNISRFKMIAKVTVPQRITKVITAASACFTKDVVGAVQLKPFRLSSETVLPIK
jgi:prenyltransferase beta subunit